MIVRLGGRYEGGELGEWGDDLVRKVSLMFYHFVCFHKSPGNKFLTSHSGGGGLGRWFGRLCLHRSPLQVQSTSSLLTISFSALTKLPFLL